MATKQKQNKLLLFLKASWAYIVAGVLIIGIGITMGVMAATSQNQSVVDVVNPVDNVDEQKPQEDNQGEAKQDEQKENHGNEDKQNEKTEEPVSAEPVTFALPMNQASVIADYTDTRLVYNPTLDRWESHFYIDLSSQDNSVFSIQEGCVIAVDYDYLTGFVVKIEHGNGLVSVYGSLGNDVLVKVGDSVTKGEKIGNASSLAASSSKYGDHLELTLLQDGKKIDPNNYLDLQNK